MDEGAQSQGDSLRLADGRSLGYIAFGPADGPVVVYCHSVPGSRLLARALAGPATELGLRVVAIDRPGIGLSDFQPARRLADWPLDVAAVADALGVGHFTVTGASSGCPYALACAWRLPERVQATAVVSPVAPIDAPGVEEGLSPGLVRLRRLGLRAPWTTRPLVAVMGRAIRRSPDKMLQRVEASSPEPDRAVLADADVRRVINDGVAEGFRQGARGVAYDMVLMGRDWGFAPSDIRTPVHLWQGEQDTTVSTAAARWLAGTIPNCDATFLPDAGHMLFFAQLHLVLRTLRDAFDNPSHSGDEAQS